jgi:hypothetical protein
MGSALTAAIVAIAALATLFVFEREADTLPHEDLHLHIEEATFKVPSGGLTVRPDPDQDGLAIASLIVLTPDANGIPPSAEAWLADDADDEHELFERTQQDTDVTFAGTVPSSFEPSVLRLVFEYGLTVSISLDGHEVGIDDGTRE